MAEINYPIKIIIADDHEILANGIASMLGKNPEFEICGTATNGREVLDMLHEQAVDLVILDMNMPKLNGIETTIEIKDKYPNTKVLILSMFDREGYIQNALDVGVDGYVLKNVNEREIDSAIYRIMGGKTYFSQDVMEKMANKMRVYGETEGGVKLSDVERKILQFISEGDTSDEIAVKLETSTHSVMSYRKMLLQKFEAKNVSHLIKVAYERGYLG
ncbi:response regulator transcription factor [Marivirga sp. S37H4]|uniref:Response regulator transcription factor n=1 Tax=Marivirga aurantiaca TaxID=2802615 RepID=A0A934X317_9BACT|nr:response regulator transcription factor [Marivirga aurantiaca]MBK6267435.1 response regulator transcription factor [Marivirga aurantiaca]